MLLTVLYMIVTAVQARRISFLKKHLYSIFKGNKSSSSIVLYTKPPQYPNEDFSAHEENENFMSSYLCRNKNLAKLGELLWYQGDVKLCSIYPQQQIDVSEWLAYPQGKSFFPLYTNNICEISCDDDHKMHILVEANLETYKPQISATATKLEDYGLITAWTTNRYMSFILETDIDRMTSFIISLMHGQYFINNGLSLTRLQSVLVSGMPCTYKNSEFQPVIDKNVFHELSHAAQIACRQNQGVEVTKLSGVTGMTIQPQGLNADQSNMSSTVLNVEDPPATGATPVSSSAPIAKVPTEEKNVKEVVEEQEASTATSSKQGSNDVPRATKRKYESIQLKVLDTNNQILKQSLEKYTLPRNSKTSNVQSSREKWFPMSNKPDVKPPNVLIYADCPDAMNSVKILLKKTLDLETYAIRTLSYEEACSNVWANLTSLVVICGNVNATISAQLVEYVVQGGKLLALCSNMLHTLLPSFKTAEVRENELVQLSYGKWKGVRMMHHIFCYHASPIRTRFSQENDDKRSSPLLSPPASTSVMDKKGKLHSFTVEELGREETWHNPSILLATLPTTGGKVVFSQIHLEIDPTQYQFETTKYKILQKSNTARLEIIADLLSTHLQMEIQHANEEITYTSAYFLGLVENKMNLVKRLQNEKKMGPEDVLKLPKIDLQFVRCREPSRSASAYFLPIMMFMCPSLFCTLPYFDALTTDKIGRLVIYSDVLTSSMDIAAEKLEHGLAVIPLRQTQGKGRGGNVWLSPFGCAMFTVQLHIPKDSTLGKRILILQHIAAVALVSAVRTRPGYEDLELRLKWPNDVYFGNFAKLGGLFISTSVHDSMYICNIGAGVNLSNEKPTICINKVIQLYNKSCDTKLEIFQQEEYLAYVFNELERLINLAQEDNMTCFNELYYKYWLHTDSNVTVKKPDKSLKDVIILGIDDNGFLLTRENEDNGLITSVHPDGNSFDLLKGLISPR